MVLSSNVHNYLGSAKKARVSLKVPEALLEPIGDIPPAEYEQMYYRDQLSHAEVA